MSDAAFLFLILAGLVMVAGVLVDALQRVPGFFRRARK